MMDLYDIVAVNTWTDQVRVEGSILSRFSTNYSAVTNLPLKSFLASNTAKTFTSTFYLNLKQWL